MTVTTTTAPATTLDPAVLATLAQLTPEQMREALTNPSFLKVFAEAARDAREIAAEAKRAAFDELTPALQMLLADVGSVQELETWYVRDSKTKKLTDKVRGQGYTLDGSVPMDMGNGTLQEWKVRVTFSRVDGSAPADVTGGPEDDDNADEANEPESTETA